MKISTRIVILVLVGFVVTFAVATVAVVGISRVARDLEDANRRVFPLMRGVIEMTLDQLEQTASFEKTLRLGVGSGWDSADLAKIEQETTHFDSLDARIKDRIRAAVALSQEVLRNVDSDAARAEMRSVLGRVQEIGGLQATYADSVQKVFYLLETGAHDAATPMFSELASRQAALSSAITRLVRQVEGFSNAATAAALERQHANMLLIVAVSGVGLILCVLLGVALGRTITQPLHAITVALGQLVRGNTAVSVEASGKVPEIAAINAAILAFRDEISDRRRTIAALADSERRFHALAQMSPVGIFHMDAEGACRYTNAEAQRITGQPPVNLAGWAWTDAVHPDDRQAMVAEWKACVAEVRPFDMEFRFQRPDGSVTWVTGRSTILTAADGTVTGFVGTATNITEQRLAAERLQASAHSRARLQEITVAHDMSLDDKVERLLALGNETFGTTMGIVSHIEGEVYTIRYIIGPPTLPPAGTTFPVGETYCVHALSADRPVGFHRAGKSEIRDHPCYRKFGLEAYIGAPVLVDGLPYGTLNFSSPAARELPFDENEYSLIHLFAQWIGAELSRSRTERILRDSEERIRTVVDNMVDGIITCDSRGVIESANPAATRMFGFEPGELVGKNVSVLAPEPHRSTHGSHILRYLTTGEAHVIGTARELEGMRADGSAIPVELAVSELTLGGERMFTAIIRDITDRKQVERMKAEFVSTVSHELRTPLTSIRGSLGLLAGGAAGELPVKLKSMLDIAFKNTQRLINLVNDILDLQRIEAGRMDFRFEPVAVAEIVETAAAANKGFADEHEVEIVVSEPLPDVQVNVDADRIGQVMANLLSNAAKFSPHGSAVTISAEKKPDWVRISVTDHGPGIPDSFRGRVFERFSQADSTDTRRAGGTGLGLNISKMIVERHEGRIAFDSEVGTGSIFYFELPVPVDGSRKPPRGTRRRPPSTRRSARADNAEKGE